MANNIISSLGGGSGIDTQNLVSQLVEAERAPTDQRLDSREEKLEAQISAYGSLKSALSAFQGVMSPLGNPDTFNARSVAFPDTDVITPNSLDAGAQTGSYQIEVLDVASSQTLVMGTQSDENAALGASGELEIQFGTWSYDASDAPTGFGVNADKPALTIEINENDSLSSIAEKINDGDSGVQASVMRVGDQYQLMLSAPSGESNGMSITGTDDGTGGASALLQGFNYYYDSGSGLQTGDVLETQQASDAVLRVNGLEISRQTNEIDDVIEGFNFTVNKASEGEKLNFSVDSDSSVAEQAVRDFVEAYNSFYQTAQNLTGYSRDENNQVVRGDLATDSSAKTLVNQLRSVLTSELEGIEDGYTALTNIGIRTELDGTLSIDEAEFSASFSNAFDEIASLFASKTSSDNSLVEVGTGTSGSRALPGSYEVNITQDPVKGAVAGSDIGTLFDSGGTLDTTGGGYSFSIEVDGTTSDLITLNKVYASAEELRSDLQSMINGDETLKGVNAAVDVSFENGAFTFTSREYGSNSSVSFLNQSVSMDQLGIGPGSTLTATEGQDVQGTINGEEGFGAGNVLLPPLGSDAYGLNLTIQPGTAGGDPFNVNYSRGLGGEMTSLISRFLSGDGVISNREENLNNQLDRIDEDRETLNARMERYEARISAEFLAMERIISSLNNTGDSLDGLVDRLPFTANNNR